MTHTANFTSSEDCLSICTITNILLQWCAFKYLCVRVFSPNFYHSQYYVVNCLFSKRIYLSVVFKKNIFIYCFQKEHIQLLFSKMISTHYLWLSKNLKNKHLKYDINKWVFFYRQDGISVVLISNRSSYRPVLEPYISDSWINRI